MMQVSSFHVLLVIGVGLWLDTGKHIAAGKNSGKQEISDEIISKLGRQRRDIGRELAPDAAAQLLEKILCAVRKTSIAPFLSCGLRLGETKRINGVKFNKKPTKLTFATQRRAIGDIFGGGLKFGSPYQPGKRSFGHVIGGGFKFGNSFKIGKKAFGHIVGGGFRLGKHVHSGKKSFGNVLSGGFRLGNPFVIIPKRDTVGKENGYQEDSLYEELSNGQADKFGLKNGNLGEQPHSLFDDFGVEKRIFGRVLGGGFKLGKRQSELKSKDIVEPRWRSIGRMLSSNLKPGRGFGQSNNPIPDIVDNTFDLLGDNGQYFGSSINFNDEFRQRSHPPIVFGSELPSRRPDVIDPYEALQRLIPGYRRVALVYDSDNPLVY